MMKKKEKNRNAMSDVIKKNIYSILKQEHTGSNFKGTRQICFQFFIFVTTIQHKN